MAVTLEELAVQFSSSGEDQIQEAFNNVAHASTQGREVVGEELQEMSVVTENTAKRFEHFSTNAVFAFADMADGSERGITRVGHSLAQLGYAFGPEVGIIATALAVVSEDIMDFFAKTVHDAEEAEKKITEHLDEMRKRADGKGIVEQARQAQGDIAELVEQAHLKRMERLKAEDAVQSLLSAGAKMNAEAVVIAEGVKLELLHEEHNLTAQIALKRKEITDAMTAALNVRSAAPDKSDVDVFGVKSTALSDEARLRELTKFATSPTNPVIEAILNNWEKMQEVDREEGKKFIKAHGDIIFEAESKGPGELFGIAQEGLRRAARAADEFNMQQSEAAKKHLQELQQAIEPWAHLVGSAIEAAFTAAFSGKGLSGAFAALGHSVLAGLGSIFEKEGEAMMVKGAIMMSLLPALSNPFTSGPALLGAGAALVALGASLAAIDHSGGGGGGGGGYGNYAYDSGGAAYGAVTLGGHGPDTSASSAARSINPMQQNVFAPTVFGINDATLQRNLANTWARMQRRGSTSGNQ